MVTFFRWIARLPSQPELADEGLGQRWPELLPIVLAAFERLSPSCRHALERHPLYPLDRWLPRAALVRRLRGPWAQGAEGFTSWASPEVRAACFAADEELALYLQKRISPESSPLSQALLCLLAVRAPERTRQLLERLAPAARQALELRLVRHDWLEAAPPPPCPARDSNDSAIRRLRLTQELGREAHERDPEAIIEGVAAALAAGELDPLDAGHAPVRRGLWAVEAADCCERLAQAVVQALDGAGRDGGGRALCFWVHSWVKPRPGEEAADSGERRNALATALRQAETIPGPP